MNFESWKLRVDEILKSAGMSIQSISPEELQQGYNNGATPIAFCRPKMPQADKGAMTPWMIDKKYKTAIGTLRFLSILIFCGVALIGLLGFIDVFQALVQPVFNPNGSFTYVLKNFFLATLSPLALAGLLYGLSVLIESNAVLIAQQQKN